MGVLKFTYIMMVLILGIVEVGMAVKPKGKVSKKIEPEEVGSVEVTINWRTNYDEGLIRLLYKVVGEEIERNSLKSGSKSSETYQISNSTFPCTHCSLVTDDKTCHEKYEVCPTGHGCFRHVFIKYGQRFLEKGCWNEPMTSTYGKCEYCKDSDDRYSCFCETCSEPMCNSEIIMGGAPSSQSRTKQTDVISFISILGILLRTFY